MTTANPAGAGAPGSATDITRPHLTLKPRGRWSAVRVREVWEFRDLLRSLAARDIRLRYRQTALGVIWVVLQPLLTALLFTFVFGRIAKLSSDGVPYIVFAYSGQLAWQFFSGILTRSSGALVGNANMISKIYFPRLVLPISALGSVVLDFIVASLVMVGLLIAYGVVPGLGLALLPIWLLLAALLAMGMGLIATAVSVRYRDVQNVILLLNQLLLFASPVAYSLSTVPKSARTYYDLNPLSGLLEAFRWSLLGRGDLELGRTIYAGLFAATTFILGAFVFASLEREFADVI
jgi:lipopolysaccharide transport system permease protein